MCGIVGYIGKQNVVPVLLKSLSKLEYRGYDSAGIAVLQDNGSMLIRKSAGRIKNLETVLLKDNINSTLGIGHTRWASHGVPCEKNSHPQVAGKFAVVHNGIIENYLQLKKFLIETDENIEFKSDTDTEVIAHLLNYYYKTKKPKEKMLDILVKLVNKIRGSYALGIVFEDDPDEIYAIKKDSPLLIGLSDGENFIASDTSALLPYTRKTYILEDHDIVCLRRDKVTIYDREKKEISRKIFEVNWDDDTAEKDGYDHFMIKEICEQPRAILNTVLPHIRDDLVDIDEKVLPSKELRNIDKVYIVACGSSYHAGMVGKYFIEYLAKIRTEVLLASEFRYFSPPLDEKTLVIMISQSGETADTLAAMREVRKLGSKTLSIVNVVGSSMTRESDFVIYTHAGPEICVATTKAYSSQLSVLYLIALELAKFKNLNSNEKLIVESMIQIPELIKEILIDKEKIKDLALEYKDAKNIFFIGRGIDYAVALEGALKLKELSYLNAQAYAAGELKHGPLSLVEEGTLVIALITQPALNEKMISNIKEVKARGASVIAITYENNELVDQVADKIVYLSSTLPLLSAQISVVPLQLLSYYMAVSLGCDVDKPRNLAKSVTIE